MLAGIVTRKNLQTFRLDDSSRTLKVHAMLRGWLVRDRLRRGCNPDTGVKLDEEAAQRIQNIVKKLQMVRPRAVRSAANARAAGGTNP